MNIENCDINSLLEDIRDELRLARETPQETKDRRAAEYQERKDRISAEVKKKHQSEIYKIENSIKDLCKNGFLEEIIELFESKDSIYKEVYDSKNFLFLQRSIEYGHLPIIKYLVKHGWDIHHEHNVWYSIDYACNNDNDVSIFEYLIDNGADINSYDNGGYSCAEMNENRELCNYINRFKRHGKDALKPNEIKSDFGMWFWLILFFVCLLGVFGSCY